MTPSSPSATCRFASKTDQNGFVQRLQRCYLEHFLVERSPDRLKHRDLEGNASRKTHAQDELEVLVNRELALDHVLCQMPSHHQKSLRWTLKRPSF